MRPIPRAMLTQTATLLQAAGENPVATLTRVYVETSTAVEQTNTDTRTERKGLLIYDARNSLPHGVVFTPDQRVQFAGELYRVETVQPMRDGVRLHHVELTLRG